MRSLGAASAVADVLDADAVGRAVAEAQPEVLVNQLRALEEALDIHHFERTFARINRLQAEATDHLPARRESG